MDRFFYISEALCSLYDIVSNGLSGQLELVFWSWHLAHAVVLGGHIIQLICFCCNCKKVGVAVQEIAGEVNEGDIYTRDGLELILGVLDRQVLFFLDTIINKFFPNFQKFDIRRALHNKDHLALAVPFLKLMNEGFGNPVFLV